MIKAIIFDLDGVIVDSEPLHFEAAKIALKNFGADLTLEDYLEFGVAKGAKNLFEKVSQKYKVDIDIEEAFKLKIESFKYIFEKEAVPREGILDLAKILHNNYLLAIASAGAKESVYFILEKIGLKKYFKVIITAADVENVKPDPEIYLKTIEKLELSRDECLAIEDSQTGLQAAKAAGLKCIAVPCDFTKTQNFFGADLLLERIADVTIESIEKISE